MTLLKRRFSLSQPVSYIFSAEETRRRCFKVLLARMIRVLSLVTVDSYNGMLTVADYPALFKKQVLGRAFKTMVYSKMDASLVVVMLLHMITKI